MISKFYKSVFNSLRYKLLMLVLFPLLLLMLIVIGMAWYWVNQVSYQQLLMKVNADLNVASEAFVDTQKKYLSVLKLFAESYAFREPVEKITDKEQQRSHLTPLIENLQKEQGFDFLQLSNKHGCDYWNPDNCNLKNSPLLEQAMSGHAVTGVEVYTSDDLNKINPELVSQVYLPLIRTPHEFPSQETAEDRGLVLMSYYPVARKDGSILSMLIGGVLLNKNFKFVDELRDLVYSKGSLAEDGLGTVTIFLDDVRISTNVPGMSNLPTQRALGTRVSEEVREQVLGKGMKWIDRAFVVSEWYVSAYQPIIDVNNNRVGMLYTGFLEAPFRETYFRGMTFLLLMFILIMGLSVLLTVAGAKSIYKPIEAMARVIKRIQQGEDLRIGKLESEDELAVLAHQLDDMLDKLQEQRKQIQNAADELEAKVQDRTEQLQRQTLDLQNTIKLLKQTREKLVANEKLAAIGELSAGIAHEVNNPTAVILGNMDILIEELGENINPVKQETDRIIQQVYRIRSIINNLLQYSRPSDYQMPWEEIDINSVIRDGLVLVQHDVSVRNVEIKLDDKATLSVKGNHQQFQQVFINLVVNAMRAVNANGKIIIRTRNWRNKGVLMVVRDNGHGMSDEVISRIFDPFYTQTKSGTGLGLYVSYGILKRFGADIAVRSRPGIGSCFFIWFYSDPVIDSSEHGLAEKLQHTKTG